MLATKLDARGFRSLLHVQIELGPGITSIVGDNGAGKTNLLEAVYFALSGRSFRTRDRRELVRFGEPIGRVEVILAGDGQSTHSLLASVSRTEGRRHLLDGQPAPPEVIARHRPGLLVFCPDRLALVKGPPAERRAHLDRFVAVLWPARNGLRQDYGRVLAQRNVLLRRVAVGLSAEAELDAWDSAVAAAAAPLIEARAEAAARLAPAFETLAAELGLENALLRYVPRIDPDPDAICVALGERRGSDVRRARTSLGPHLDELELRIAERQLRRYGSQGEQRTALLALLFAEREALIGAGMPAPLMLLDDVMSELDPRHRELLATRLEGAGQSMVSAADEEALPAPAVERLVRMPWATAGALKAVA
jgi:DNA replication and repair protein RecF